MKNEVNREYTTSLASVSKTIEPSLYKVVVHNDDFTPMEFVVGLLEKFFYMDRRKATGVMMEAHLNGAAFCGVYTREVAETKTAEVIDYARNNEYPLVCSVEVASFS